MTIRSGGIVSGLDTNAIIEALVTAERTPITKLSTQRADFSLQLSKIANLKSALGKLDQAAGALSSTRDVLACSASSSDSSQFTATATGAATQGSHQVQVLALATSERDRSAAFGSASDVVRAGTLTVQVEGQDDVVVDVAEGMTLLDVAAAINASSARVTANVLQTGTAAYLDIVADDSGHSGASASDAVQLIESYTGGTGTELGLAELTQAQNAQFTLDGLTLTRRSNTVGDALTGLTLQLRGVGTSLASLDVAVAPDAVVVNITTLVTAYNELMKLVNGELQVGESTARRGALSGDPTVRSLRMSLAAALGGVTAGDPPNLAAAGITTQRDGTLAIDDGILRSTLAQSPAGVASLFTDATQGTSARLKALVDRYLDYVDGALPMREKGIQRSIQALESQIERLEARAARYEERLVLQFTALENALSGLRSQESYLSSVLGGKG
ncbi:MAG: flagellar filament capping protein FliD [Pseudomonadota bacterium]